MKLWKQVAIGTGILVGGVASIYGLYEWEKSIKAPPQPDPVVQYHDPGQEPQVRALRTGLEQRLAHEFQTKADIPMHPQPRFSKLDSALYDAYRQQCSTGEVPDSLRQVYNLVVTPDFRKKHGCTVW